MVDECEGCMNVGDVGLHRPKHVASDAKDGLHQKNAMEASSDKLQKLEWASVRSL